MDNPFPAYKGDEPFVFVSYAHADEATVFPQIQRLHDAGFNIYYDEGINPGASWRDELADAILNASLFLFFVTPRSAASTNCEREVHFAADHERRMLAVHLEKTQLPSGLGLAFGNRQAILKYDLAEEDFAQKLISGVSEYLDRDTSRPVTPLPERRTRRQVISLALVAVAAIAITLWLVVPGSAPTGNTSETDAVETTVAETLSPGIAVLPFENLSPVADNAYFAAGIHEDLLSALSRIQGLKVIARNSMVRYQETNKPLIEIARELNVNHILQGSVRRAGDQVRISVRLIDPVTEAQLWTETYDRKLTDIFRIQSEVAQSVATQLEVSLDLDVVRRLQVAPTQNVAAYDGYLRARELFNAGQLSAAMLLVDEVLAMDPEFGPAHALKGMWLLLTNPEYPAIRDTAWELVNTALRLSPQDSDAHAFAGVLSNYDADYDTAVGYLQESLRLNPNNANGLWGLGVTYISIGDNEAAIRTLGSQLEIDPYSNNSNYLYGKSLLLQGEIDTGTDYIDRAMRLSPAFLPYRIASADFFAIDPVRSLRYLNEAHDRNPEDAITHASIAWLLLTHDAFDEATAILQPAVTQGNYDVIQAFMNITTARAATALTHGQEDLGEILGQMDTAIDRWHDYDSQNNRLSRAAGGKHSINASLALRAGNVTVFFEEQKKGIAARMMGLSSPLTVTSTDSWDILSVGAAMTVIGEPDASRYLRAIVDHYETAPLAQYAALQSGIAELYLGKPEEAMANLERCFEPTQLCAPWLIRSYGLYGTTHDLSDPRFDTLNRVQTFVARPAFRDFIQRLVANKAKSLAMLREAYPHLVGLEHRH